MSVSPLRAADPVAKAIAGVARRVRLQRALDAACVLGVAGAAVVGLGVCLLKTGDARLGWAVSLSGLAMPLLGALLGALRPVSGLLAARLCDRAIGGQDLLASAWSFAHVAESQRTPFMRACVERARVRAADLRARRAFPLRAPRGLRELGALVVGVSLLALLELPVATPQPITTAPRARLLHHEDLAAFREEVDELALAGTLDADARRAADEANALLEALADGELERMEALRELRRLEDELSAQQGESREALDEALRELGDALGRKAMIDSVAEALAEADAESAARELSRLAERLDREAPGDPARQKLEQSLRRGAKKPGAELERALERKRRELQRLLDKKNAADGAQSERDKRLLRKKRRELDKLEREQRQKQAGRRELDKLRRELGDAAESLAQRDGGGASRELESAAQEMARLREQQLSKEQRAELRKRLAQLREQISKQREQRAQQGKQGQQGGRQGQGAEGQAQRLSLGRFGQLARGEQGKQGKQGKQGQQGEGDENQGALLVPGQGDGKRHLILPGGEQAGSATLQIESAEGQDQAGHGGRPGEGAATELDARHVDTQLSGEKGKGPTRSEIIADSSSRGFASRSYQQVHAEYEKHAESVLERDEVPGGYRFYVRRYFQLIRPREENP